MGRLSKLLHCGAMAALALSTLTGVAAAKFAKEANPTVVASSSGLKVNNAEYHIRGIAYSPVPVGEAVSRAPNGDYFTPDYAYIWSRDLPAIAAAGFDTVRIYAWNNTVDHSLFLDALQEKGLRAILTFYVDPLTTPESGPNEGISPTWTKTEQAAVIKSYTNSVAMYGDHPAILMWAFGNELNGPWLNIVQKFDEDTSTSPACGWQVGNNGGPCFNLEGADWVAGSTCDTAATCMYTKFFGWLSDAGMAGREFTSRPQTSTFADVDYFMTNKPATDRLKRFGGMLEGLDVITVQVYRGGSFDDYFTQYAAQTDKPLLIGEYGADSFNDPCGWPEYFTRDKPCENYLGQTSGRLAGLGGSDGGANFKGCATAEGATPGTCALSGVEAQSNFDKKLTDEMLAQKTRVIGGILMEWHDENWKNQETQDRCGKPCAIADGATIEQAATTIAQCYQQAAYQSTNAANGECTSRAHITCSNFDAKYHDLCGYYLTSAPDAYVNEAWFGVNGVEDCNVADADKAHRLSALKPRQVLTTLAGSAQTAKTCDELKPCWTCVSEQWGDENQRRAHIAPGVAEGKCNTACGFSFSPATNSGSGSSSTGPSSGPSGTTPTSSGSSSTGPANTTPVVYTSSGLPIGGGPEVSDGAAASVQASVVVGAALATAALLL